MSETKLLHIHDHYGASVAHVSKDAHRSGDIYIGRQSRRQARSKWRNPYRFTITGVKEIDRQERWRVVVAYATFLASNPELKRDLQDLKDRRLMCWCRLSFQRVSYDRLCHGDVLAQAVTYGESFDHAAVTEVMDRLKAACEESDQVDSAVAASFPAMHGQES